MGLNCSRKDCRLTPARCLKLFLKCRADGAGKGRAHAAQGGDPKPCRAGLGRISWLQAEERPPDPQSLSCHFPFLSCAVSVLMFASSPRESWTKLLDKPSSSPVNQSTVSILGSFSSA